MHSGRELKSILQKEFGEFHELSSLVWSPASIMHCAVAFQPHLVRPIRQHTINYSLELKVVYAIN